MELANVSHGGAFCKHLLDSCCDNRGSAVIPFMCTLFLLLQMQLFYLTDLQRVIDLKTLLGPARG